ncbi:1,2-phenylacetyl-CoA epoxidase subunit PaaE [Chromobacterium sp. Beijing]|uniref:1,2-phenylacetyl-CoA epoxidase subunit PaaE n=1 Tax=Chromobacterium sp. Beijing TaxID=2735795 RepID=UPI001F2BCD39|nr:1,2-phenylacetyl-CoA epoxidase subunit PaaE [Chromobacterium sp. Beijing]UJB33381.1 phenylacetate-CoA oxygenase/reductase subunit PaaK [Chromobacterium sp. Beijing]
MRLAFHRLRVVERRQETDDAISLTLEPPAEFKERFRFTQGQHLVFREHIDGVEQRRTYSLCCGADEGILRVAVKRVEGGVFSSHVHRHWQLGQEVEAMPPEGRFFTPLAAEQRKHYLGIVAGSGITPLLSTLKTTLRREPHSRFTLLYGNRRRGGILFADELAALKSRYPARLAVYHFLSREAQQPELFHGRLDGERLHRALAALLPDGAVDEAFVCGPNDMIDQACACLERVGLAAGRIHYERFGVPGRGAAKPAAAAEDNPAASVTLIIDGQQRQLELSAGERILEAATAAGVDLPYSCQGGVCCTCRAKVLSGRVSMDKNFALEAAEVEQGFVLACQARPRTQQVVLSFDER